MYGNKIYEFGFWNEIVQIVVDVLNGSGQTTKVQ